jgi:DNA/RNA-binding domain of Phe-tRNA-synthetase-like protein
MLRFRYDDPVLAAYPTTRGGLGLARDLQAGPTPAALAGLFRAEQRAVLDRLGGRPLSEVPSLAAWRSVFRSFGVEPTRYRSAAEALLRRLAKKGEIPCVNALVDIANLVSIRYALPISVLDASGLVGAVTVRLARGDEPFTELDSDEVRHPEPGEVVFVDDAGRVCARRWCWRQSAQSAAGASTREALVTVEGHHPGADEDVRKALEDLRELVLLYAGGTWRSQLLSPEHPAFTA